MSIIQDIQNRALDEGRIKAENVNSYKVLSVRPSAQLSALIEVLAFLDCRSHQNLSVQISQRHCMTLL